MSCTNEGGKDHHLTLLTSKVEHVVFANAHMLAPTLA